MSATDAKPRRRLWPRILAAATVLLVLFTVVGFLVLPPIVKSVLVNRLSKMLGRPVVVAQVRTNPFALSATVRGLRVGDLDGQTLLAWDQLYVNLRVLSFVTRGWSFDAIELDHPSGRLVMKPDGSLNISDIVQRLTAPTPGAAPAKPAAPIAIRIQRLRVNGASLTWEDLSLASPFKTVLGPVTIALD